MTSTPLSFLFVWKSDELKPLIMEEIKNQVTLFSAFYIYWYSRCASFLPRVTLRKVTSLGRSEHLLSDRFLNAP